jgi:hypothetical protein
MIRILKLLFVGVSVFGILPQAWSQTADNPEAIDEIVVEGLYPEALKTEIQGLADPGPTGQLARWKGNICPEVIGIAPEFAELFIDRIFALARLTDLTRGASSCRPSILVLVTEDADATAKSVIDKYGWDLRQDGQTQIERFIASDKPVRWVSVTDPCGFGCPLQNSRILLSTSPALTAMFIVVDAAGLSGYDINEIADYVAMVVLSNPASEVPQSDKSIMSMFDRPRPAEGKFVVTRYDRAFVESLYDSQPDNSAERQWDSILGDMINTLSKD